MAFDTVDHTILLNKLDYYGIKGLALEWFKNYLSDRLQYVKIGGVSSHMLLITCSTTRFHIGPFVISHLCQ